MQNVWVNSKKTGGGPRNVGLNTENQWRSDRAIFFYRITEAALHISLMNETKRFSGIDIFNSIELLLSQEWIVNCVILMAEGFVGILSGEKSDWLFSFLNGLDHL